MSDTKQRVRIPALRCCSLLLHCFEGSANGDIARGRFKRPFFRQALRLSALDVGKNRIQQQRLLATPNIAILDRQEHPRIRTREVAWDTAAIHVHPSEILLTLAPTLGSALGDPACRLDIVLPHSFARQVQLAQAALTVIYSFVCGFSQPFRSLCRVFRNPLPRCVHMSEVGLGNAVVLVRRLAVVSDGTWKVGLRPNTMCVHIASANLCRGVTCFRCFQGPPQLFVEIWTDTKAAGIEIRDAKL